MARSFISTRLLIDNLAAISILFFAISLLVLVARSVAIQAVGTLALGSVRVATTTIALVFPVAVPIALKILVAFISVVLANDSVFHFSWRLATFLSENNLNFAALDNKAIHFITGFRGLSWIGEFNESKASRSVGCMRKMTRHASE
jgi:hypothetical protein